MARDVIWTNEIRVTMYQVLVREFGSHDSWTRESHPGNRREYDALLQRLAQGVTNKSGRRVTPAAVEQQIMFAKTRQRFINKRQLRQFMLNKAAAIEAGFISAESLSIWFSRPVNVGA